jgi:hypothetical protein
LKIIGKRVVRIYFGIVTGRRRRKTEEPYYNVAKLVLENRAIDFFI